MGLFNLRTITLKTFFTHKLFILGLVALSSLVLAEPIESDSNGKSAINLPEDKEVTYTLNFKDADIKELIKFVADTTGKIVIIDPKVKGNIEVISKTEVGEEELYAVFLNILEVHGFTAVETEDSDVIRIIPQKNARTSALPVIKGTATIANPEYVTQIIPLKNVNASKLIPVLRPLIPQQGHMAAYTDTNSIIVTDNASNVAKIVKIIKNLDQSPHKDVEIVKLKYAAADEITKMITQINKNTGNSKNQPAEDSVDIVADDRSNSVLLNGTLQARERIKKIIRGLDVQLARSGNAQVFRLRHAKAKELAPVLSKVVQNMVKMTVDLKSKSASQKNATIEADAASNSLIVTAQPDIMESLTGLVQQLDIARQMVLVEAIIAEITLSDDKGLGLDFLFAGKNSGIGGSNTSGNIGKAFSGALTSNTDDQAKGLLGGIAGIVGGFDYNPNGNSFGAILTAIENNTDSNILSTPSIMTLDNKEASIVVGRQVPFVTGSYTSTGSGSNPGNPFQTIERNDVGITLKVTPHVNSSGEVTLEIVQEASEAPESSTGTIDPSQVVTTERKINTSVRVKDGGVVVLGGLIQDKAQEVVKKVPLLGDIPVMGHLFKSTTSTTRKTNLVVFIRPKVMEDSSSVTNISKKKYQHMQASQAMQYNEGLDFFPKERIPVLPDWEEQIRALEGPAGKTDGMFIPDLDVEAH
jgi:general secretion pathway protein D